MIRIPPAPPDADVSHGQVHLRYEDVSQDGRLLLEVAPIGLGATVWRRVLGGHPIGKVLARAGIVPILTHLAIEASDGPFGITAPLDAVGSFALAHSRDSNGQVERIVLNMWCELTAPIGRVYPPPPERAGEHIFAARVFARHVMTRLFAPPGERRVTELRIPNEPLVPPMLDVQTLPESLLEPPDGATALDEQLVLDTAPLVFGLMHTDSNQHVNSLVYLRAFEEAMLRRVAAHGRPTAVLSRALEIAYRKPFFAGQTARLAVRAFEHRGATGACGGFFLDGVDPLAARPHATIRVCERVCER